MENRAGCSSISIACSLETVSAKRWPWSACLSRRHTA